MNAVEIIKKKRNNGVLSEEEINYFVSEYVAGSIPDYQKSALLMTIYFNGLNDAETLGFVKAYINSGTKLDLSHIKKPKVDKHSTGGVGDKTSIILAPLVACFDVVVPMMSGRGLGHTGGTLDKLESIPGFSVHLSITEFVKNLEKLNVSMIGQTDELTPADKMIYALRDVTATVENVGLITASITSKKIAEGAEGIVYDVKAGCGSTLPTQEKSRELAEKLLKTSKDFGQKAVAVITDMNSPLGYAVGNWAEIRECIELMNPRLSKSALSDDLLEVTLFLAGAMLMLAGKSAGIEEGINMAKKKLENGECFQRFKELIKMQRGSVESIEDIDSYPGAKHTQSLTAEADGYISNLDALIFGTVSVNLGCGRKKVDDRIDYSASILLEKKIGSPVKKGDIICTIAGDSHQKTSSAKKALAKGITISQTKPQVKSRILEVIY